VCFLSLLFKLLLTFVLQAYTYHGESLLKEDKCGEAIRSVQESIKCKLMNVHK
jgi:hypothetical protein